MSKVKKKDPVKPGSKSGPGRWMYLALLVISLLLFGNTVNNGFTLDDDVFFLKHSSVQKGLKGINEIFSFGNLEKFDGTKGIQAYRPVTLLSFAVEKEFAGTNPKTAHWINVWIYVLVILVVYFWLTRLFPSYSSWLTGFTVLLFLAHPVHTEVVASVKSRDELLAALFGFLALAASIDRNGKSSSWSRTSAASCFFLLALFSKESSITLTLIFPLVFMMFSSMSWKNSLLKSIPYFAAAAFFLFIRHEIFKNQNFDPPKETISNILYSANGISELLGTKMEILLLYIRLLFIPFPLSWDYSFNQVPVTGLSSLLPWLSLLLHVALLVIGILWFRKKPVLSFSILFYLITFSLTNNFFVTNLTTAAERFMFVPSLGFVTALVFGTAELLRLNKITFEGKSRAVLVYGSVMLFLVYSVITINRNSDWATNMKLFASGAKYSPNSTRANAALASAFRDKGDAETNPSMRTDFYTQAIDYYKRSLSILPSNIYASYNLGVTYSSLGDTANACAYYRQTIKNDSVHKLALNNLGILYWSQGKYDSALVFMERLHKASPDDPLSIQNLSAMYFFKQEYPRAIELANEAIRIDIKSVKSYQILSQIYDVQGNKEEAVKYQHLYEQYSK